MTREREDSAEQTNCSSFGMVVLGVQDRVVLMVYLIYGSFFTGDFHMVSDCLLRIW